MSILIINAMALELVAKDFSDGHSPSNGGPTKTSRALAIIHLAARDAYAKVTSAYPPKLAKLPNTPSGLPTTGDAGKAAVLGAGFRAASMLYPDFLPYINDVALFSTSGANPAALAYGALIADKWLDSREKDGSALPQIDTMYSQDVGHHRADPVSKMPTLGRKWGQVTPFVIAASPKALPVTTEARVSRSKAAAGSAAITAV